MQQREVRKIASQILKQKFLKTAYKIGVSLIVCDIPITPTKKTSILAFHFVIEISRNLFAHLKSFKLYTNVGHISHTLD